MIPNEDTNLLLRNVRDGRVEAVNELLERHRARLHRMVAARIDQRIAARFDPSDVVQETLVEASRRLAQFTAARPVPFYVWLRQLAADRLNDLYRRHLRTRTRSVLREAQGCHPDASVGYLTECLVDSGTSPTRTLQRAELCERVRHALARLDARDRELLLMRHLEQMSVPEIAAALELHTNAAKSRLRRALERLHCHLDLGDFDCQP